MRALPLFFACLLFAPQPSWAKAEPDAATAQEEETPRPENNMVVLQGLNKVTGHISTIEGPLGVSLHFGTIEIVPRRCWTAPPEEQPENAALLEILERKPNEAPTRIFSGWMFSSSPGLSGLEHPVYDVTVLRCEYRENPEVNETSDGAVR